MSQSVFLQAVIGMTRLCGANGRLLGCRQVQLNSDIGQPSSRAEISHLAWPLISSAG
jgi:hypothetical protein